MDGKPSTDKLANRFLKAAFLGGALFAEPESIDMGDSRAPIVSLEIRTGVDSSEQKEELPKLLITEESLPELLPALMKNASGEAKYQIEFDPKDFPSIINPQNVQRNIDAAEQLNRWGYFLTYVDGYLKVHHSGFNYGPLAEGEEFKTFGLGNTLLEKSTFEGFPQVTIEDPVAMKNDFIKALQSIDIRYRKAGVRSDIVDLFFVKVDLSACPDLATDESAFRKYEQFWERYVVYEEFGYGMTSYSEAESEAIVPVLEKIMSRKGLQVKNLFHSDSVFSGLLKNTWNPEVISFVATNAEETVQGESLETYFENFPDKYSDGILGSRAHLGATHGALGNKLQVTVADAWSPHTIKLLGEADARWVNFSVITSPDVPANHWNQPRSWQDVSRILDVADGDARLLRFVDFSLLPIIPGDPESIYQLPALLGLESAGRTIRNEVSVKMLARLEFSSVPFEVTSENALIILKEAEALRDVFGEEAERAYLDRLDFSGYANTFDIKNMDQILSTVQQFERHSYSVRGASIERPLRDAYQRQVKLSEINEAEMVPIVVTPDQIEPVAKKYASIYVVLGPEKSDYYLAHLRFTDMSVQMDPASIAEMVGRLESIGGQLGDREAERKFVDAYIHAIDFSSFPQVVQAKTLSQILDGAFLLSGYRSYGPNTILDEYIKRLDRPLVSDDFRFFIAHEKDFRSLAQRYNHIDQIFEHGIADAYIANAKFSFLPSIDTSRSLSQRLDRTSVLMEKANKEVADDDEWRDDGAVRSTDALKALLIRFSGEVTTQEVEQLQDVLTTKTVRTIEARCSLLRAIRPDFEGLYLSGLIIPDISSRITLTDIRALSLLSVGPVKFEYQRRLTNYIEEQKFEGFPLSVSRKNISEIADVHQDIEKELGVEIGQKYFDSLSFSAKEFPRQLTDKNFDQIGESLFLLKNTGGKPFADAYAHTIEPVEMIKFAPVITNDNLSQEYAKKILIDEYKIGISEESIKSTIQFNLPESISTFVVYQETLKQIDMVALFNTETATSLRKSLEERIDWKGIMGDANLLDVREIESLRLSVNKEMGAGLGDEILMQVGIRFIDSKPVTWDTIDIKLRFVEAYLGVDVDRDVKGMYEMLANFQVTQILKFFENEGVLLDDERVAETVLRMQSAGINLPVKDSSMQKIYRSWNQPSYVLQKAKSKLASDTGVLRDDFIDVQIFVEKRAEKLQQGYKFITWKDGQGNELAKIVVGSPKQGAFVDYAIQVGGGLTEEAIKSRYQDKGIIAESVGAYTTGALKPAELAIENGKVKNYLISDRDGMAIISKEGRLRIVHRDKLTTHDLDPDAAATPLSFHRNISDFRTLLGVASKRELDIMCGHLLVDDGELSVSDQSSEVKDKRRAIVTFKDGTFGLVDFTERITLYEEAVILKAAGASNAINLDTGYYDHANIYTADGSRIELGDQDKDGTNNKFVFLRKK